MHKSQCRHCHQTVYFSAVIADTWCHSSGSAYCQNAEGFTATPIRQAEPVLETETL